MSAHSSSEPAKGLECFLHRAHFCSRHEAACKRLLGALAEQIRSKTCDCAVVECSAHGGHRHRAGPCSLTRRDISVVQDKASRHAKASATPAQGQREMDLGGQNIRKPVQCERRPWVGLEMGPASDASS